MFKHAVSPPEAPLENKANPVLVETDKQVRPIPKDTSPVAMRELLEKNLKWSQIIYEQNRKINSKLLWAVIAGWIRLLVIVVPLVLTIWFLPTIIRELQTKYGLFVETAAQGKLTPSAINGLLDILPVNPVERERLKAMLGGQQQPTK